MRTLFIYFSYTGNGNAVAAYLAEKGADVRKVQAKKPLPRSFFFGMMTGGFLAGIGHKSKLVDFDPSVEGYDRVVIGSPIWNGRLSCPINAALASLSLGETPVSFVLYAGGGEAPKAIKRLAKEYPNAGVVILKEPKKYQDEFSKLSVLFDLNGEV